MERGKGRIINFISSIPSVMTVTTAFRQIPRSTKVPKMLTDSIFTCSSAPSHNLFDRRSQTHDVLNETALQKVQMSPFSTLRQSPQCNNNSTLKQG